MAVYLSAYSIDILPVTNGAFAEFVNAGCYSNPAWWSPAGWNHVTERRLDRPTYFDDPLWGSARLPVTGVSWWEATAYARYRRARLPTEAEWERACRGPGGCTYPWGEEPPTLAHATFSLDGRRSRDQPNAPDELTLNESGFGCKDMVGNFAEWCIDNYQVTYPIVGRDPVVVLSEWDDHVVRGGSGLHSAEYLRCAARDSFPPGVRDNMITFRCVRSDGVDYA